MLWVVVPTLLILVPWLLPTARLLTLATITSINAIVLYGLAVLYGQAGMLSIAHAALWGIGGYAGAWLLIELDLSFWAVLPIAPLVAALAAACWGIRQSASAATTSSSSRSRSVNSLSLC